MQPQAWSLVTTVGSMVAARSQIPSPQAVRRGQGSGAYDAQAWRVELSSMHRIQHDLAVSGLRQLCLRESRHPQLYRGGTSPRRGLAGEPFAESVGG